MCSGHHNRVISTSSGQLWMNIDSIYRYRFYLPILAHKAAPHTHMVLISKSQVQTKALMDIDIEWLSFLSLSHTRLAWFLGQVTVGGQESITSTIVTICSPETIWPRSKFVSVSNYRYQSLIAWTLSFAGLESWYLHLHIFENEPLISVYRFKYILAFIPIVVILSLWVRRRTIAPSLLPLLGLFFQQACQHHWLYESHRF